ncbi:hypothetical protein ACP70R_030197 [Stipagrostis hirtigluma subsp. patula]
MPCSAARRSVLVLVPPCPPRRRRLRRVAERARHVLQRPRRVRHEWRGVLLREHVQRRVRPLHAKRQVVNVLTAEQSSVEHLYYIEASDTTIHMAARGWEPGRPACHTQSV